MRICTYNIHGGTDPQRRPSLPRIIETIQASDCDVVLLQEVDRFLPRSGFRDQAATLAFALKSTPYFFGRLRFASSAFGNAVLTRRSATTARRLALPSSGGEPRCAIGVEFALESGGPCAIWSTHLGLDQSWRRTQLGALADEIGRGPATAVVGGDFNSRIEDDEVQQFLEETGLAPVTADALTFPAPAPTSRIDFIFARGLRQLASGAIAGPGSDHCLVWTELVPIVESGPISLRAEIRAS